MLDAGGKHYRIQLGFESKRYICGNIEGRITYLGKVVHRVLDKLLQFIRATHDIQGNGMQVLLAGFGTLGEYLVQTLLPTTGHNYSWLRGQLMDSKSEISTNPTSRTNDNHAFRVRREA